MKHEGAVMMTDIAQACDGRRYYVASGEVKGLLRYETRVFAIDDETGEIGETALYRKGYLVDWEMAVFHRHICEHVEGYVRR